MVKKGERREGEKTQQSRVEKGIRSQNVEHSKHYIRKHKPHERLHPLAQTRTHTHTYKDTHANTFAGKVLEESCLSNAIDTYNKNYI